MIKVRQKISGCFRTNSYNLGLAREIRGNIQVTGYAPAPASRLSKTNTDRPRDSTWELSAGDATILYFGPKN
jgi:hypothetical protein